MTDARPVIQLEGDEQSSVHATWGRSGKRAIVTIASGASRSQVVLTVGQAAELGRFLITGPEGPS